MASRGSSFTAFQHVKSSRCVSNSSFSIRSILDLPEENVEKCTGSLSRNDSPVDSQSVSLPLVPRVVRPMILHYADSVQCSTLRNWQDIRFAPYGQQCAYGALSFREQGFPIGEWINSIQISARVMPSAQTDSYTNYKLKFISRSSFSCKLQSLYDLCMDGFVTC